MKKGAAFRQFVRVPDVDVFKGKVRELSNHAVRLIDERGCPT